jgi:PIN domain nuclease of toxin-antitoxin system
VSGVVLDASALLALLLREPGADRVAAKIDEACISSVNLAEVVGHYAKLGGTEAQVRTSLSGLSLEVAPFGESDAYRVGLLRPLGETVGLSLGDRACLSLARLRGEAAMTADRAWLAIGQAYGVTIEMIR